MNTLPDNAETIFARHRARIFAVAYRLTGTISDAEDVVQEAWLRWSGTNITDIHSPEAWLVTTAGRLGLDHLRRLKARRETYVGSWLPEPIINAATDQSQPTPEDTLALADDISMALMHMLERLAPDERAAFLLHEAFDYDYRELATVLNKSEAACRQIVSRARRHVADTKPRFHANPRDHEKLAGAFSMALANENPSALLACLKPDAVLYSDGGGKAAAALNPIFSADRITRFFIGIARKFGLPLDMHLIDVNGQPGFVLLHDSKIHSIISFDLDEGMIETIYVMRNPDKLTHAAKALGLDLLEM